MSLFSFISALLFTTGFWTCGTVAINFVLNNLFCFCLKSIIFIHYLNPFSYLCSEYPTLFRMFFSLEIPMKRTDYFQLEDNGFLLYLAMVFGKGFFIEFWLDSQRTRTKGQCKVFFTLLRKVLSPLKESSWTQASPVFFPHSDESHPNTFHIPVPTTVVYLFNFHTHFRFKFNTVLIHSSAWILSLFPFVVSQPVPVPVATFPLVIFFSSSNMTFFIFS